jgi:hypothetical protein
MNSALRIGAGAIDITPDFETDLSGFASREQPSSGVLDPIFARAIYLESESGRLLWVVCDLLALEKQFVESFRAWAKRSLGLERNQVLLSVTHTHYAPATVELFACGRRSARYIEFLHGKIEELARDAMSKLQPCEMVIAHADCDLAIDRRKKPSAHVDPQVWSIGFRALDGQWIALLVNYTMHPVTFGHIERRISADWCGVVSRELSRQLGGHSIVMVTNGAAGNINPPRINAPPEEANRTGQMIADRIISPLRNPKAQAAPVLMTRSITIPIDLDWHDAPEIDRIADRYIADFSTNAWGEQFRTAINAWREKMKRMVAAGEGKTWEIELQAIRIGEVIIIAVNGEMFTRFTDYVRRSLPGKNVFVVAYSNAAAGYIPTREAYGEGGYEVETSHFFYGSFRPKSGTLELLAERAAELIKQVNA